MKARPRLSYHHQNLSKRERQGNFHSCNLVSLWDREKPGHGKNRTSTRVSTKRMIMTALQVIGDRWLVNGRIRDQKRCQRSPLALHLHLRPLTIDKQCQWLAQSLNTRTMYSHISHIAAWNNVSVVHTSVHTVHILFMILTLLTP